ncbi:MAG: hypothetical protein RL427_469 [Bacteroidota bacterium]|jgi:acetyltransferase-like isoleucine patch superfamily enzyme
MKTITQNLLSYVALSTTALLFGFQVQAATVASTSSLIVETNRLWLDVTDAQGAFCQTLIGYRSGATSGYDHALDGAFMNDGAVSLSTLIGDTRYAIQFKGLPFSPTDVVPISFSATYNGTYTFNIDHMDGFFTSPTFGVYIYDTVTNTYTNLKTTNYTFTSTVGTFNSRFQITYTTASSNLGVNTNAFSAANVNVYKDNAAIVINTGSMLLTNVAIYTINGQVVYQNNQANTSALTINPEVMTTQPLIIKVTTEEGITVSKKWLYY